MSESGGQSVVFPSEQGILLGRYDHALDPKKRLTVPAGWRELMNNPRYLYVLPDTETKSLNLVTAAEVQRFMARVKEHRFFDRELGEALRQFGENSEQVLVDVQGRIRICDRLLTFAGLTGKVVMIGALTRIQLWSPELQPGATEIDQGAFSSSCAKMMF